MFTKQTFIKSETLEEYPKIVDVIDAIMKVCDGIGLRAYNPNSRFQKHFGILDNYFISYLAYLFFGKMLENYYTK